MRISIAGFGSVCENIHIPAIKRILDFEIAGIYDPSPARLDLAGGLTGSSLYVDLDEMFDRENPDCLLVTTHPSSHKEIIVKALQKGINVICEKPLCITLAEFDEIVDAARGNDRVVFTLNNWKYAPHISKMVEISEAISDVKYIFWNTSVKRPSIGWESQSRDGEGMSVDEILIHYGWNIFHTIRRITHSEADQLPFFRSDEMSWDRIFDFRISYKNGCYATIHLIWDAPYERNFSICYGENGWFEFLNDRMFFETSSGSGSYFFDERLSHFSSNPDEIYQIYLDFLRSLDDTNLREDNLKEASECVRMIEMLHRSSKLRG